MEANKAERASKWLAAWPDSADMVFVSALYIPEDGILGNSFGPIVPWLEGGWIRRWKGCWRVSPR
jgi:hypothetical protein